MPNYIILILVTFANPWIWRLWNNNLTVFLLAVVTTFILWISLYTKFINKLWILSILLFLGLLYFQFSSTKPQSLTLLDNDEQRVRSLRLSFYNPSSHYMRVLFAHLNLKNFLEGDFNIASTRWQRNFFETIDPNVYFFGGHPRGRVWANDFEKFPFIFVLPFLLGLYSLINKKQLLFWSLLGFTIFIVSFWGHKNTLGPFVIFPFLIIATTYGANLLFRKTKAFPKSWQILSLFSGVVIIIISIIQSFIYAA